MGREPRNIKYFKFGFPSWQLPTYLLKLCFLNALRHFIIKAYGAYCLTEHVALKLTFDLVNI